MTIDARGKAGAKDPGTKVTGSIVEYTHKQEENFLSLKSSSTFWKVLRYSGLHVFSQMPFPNKDCGEVSFLPLLV